jgi:anhydro-N-acetylmuramic acid kinase
MMLHSKKKFRVIGIMSGTSLDGVDIALCQFKLKKKTWYFSIEHTMTAHYPSSWERKLSQAHLFSGNDLLLIHQEYGKYLGELCFSFIKKNSIKNIDLIASHGHTIFHQPSNGITFQLGNGNAIYAVTKIPVAYDFRSLDIALGGQGAPLVPIGDRLLFSEFDYCLNLGGIANISFENKHERKAFDICFCNMALNYLAAKLKKPFDENGVIASSGKMNEPLRKKIESIYKTFRKTRPSLAREQFENEVKKIIDNNSISVADRLRTVCESIAHEIADCISKKKKKSKILITGGGAHNRFLIQLIQTKLEPSKIIIPDKTIIDFKEALIFAFLGVLKCKGKINVLKSATGATADSSSGVIVGIGE